MNPGPTLATAKIERVTCGERGKKMLIQALSFTIAPLQSTPSPDQSLTGC